MSRSSGDEDDAATSGDHRFMWSARLRSSPQSLIRRVAGERLNPLRFLG